MASTTLRLLLFLGVLFFYAFTHPHGVVVFTLHFMLFYLCFTVFEVASLYRHFGKKD
jgi:hypothetical protein